MMEHYMDLRFHKSMWLKLNNKAWKKVWKKTRKI